MRQNRSKDKLLETVSLLDELPDRAVFSSKSKGWNGIVTEYYHHPANELVSPPLSQHLITLNCGSPYHLVQQLDGQVYQGQVLTGEMILTPANYTTQWCWDSQVDVLHLCLEPKFIDKVALEAVEVDANRVEILNCFAGADLQIQHLGNLLLVELQSEKLGNRLYTQSLTNALAVHLIRKYSSIQKTVRQYSGGLPKSKLQWAITYIQENLNQDLSLDEIAAEVNLSSYHFARLFKQSTGLAPHQYQIRCRVERAKELLQQGQMAIADVATHVGFYDQSHLSRHFKRMFGVSPKVIQQNSNNILWISKSVQDSTA
ncbi:AraC family transcriptional regulator [Nostoc sp. CHAB 5784]|uniref:AraC family transcriptional regulator n=1 Tax=Nostoc favosum CHAB5714 TaxID=2780399 RepID=A0ABS8IGH9_9NOSO|nr:MULTISPECIES: AraC family transcriptional regulator [Nostoc]MCC5603198.1 AraC family transcriptional regulator [Nostoc favosum CHAB5714]MCC5670045.1 AraC family transcriptional regulator [Nostoc mirabile CHAB5784]